MWLMTPFEGVLLVLAIVAMMALWNGSRQVGQPVTIALSKAPRIRVLVERVRQALGQQPVKRLV